MNPASQSTQQDNFKIDHKKTIVIRQDRYLAEEGQIFVEINELSYPVIDFSSFGISIFSKIDLHKNQDELNAKIRIINVELPPIGLKFIRSENYYHEGMSGFKIAFQIMGSPLNVHQIQTIIETNKIILQHEKTSIPAALPIELKLITYEIRNWLTNLEKMINELEKNSFDESVNDLQTFESTVTTIVAKYIEDNVYPRYGIIEQILKKFSTTDPKEFFTFFRSQVGEFMFQSSYANRAHKKPRGYAGDFQMMRSIYQREQRGATLFGKCVEKYFIEVPESQAVRNRSRFLEKKIADIINVKSKEHIKIVSVACGPAMEIQLLIKDFPELLTEKVEIFLIDQDTEALKECQKQIEYLSREHNLKCKFYFKNWAIKNIIEQGLGIDNISIVYTAGLFDYLTDPVAHFAAKKLFESIETNGELIIGNFDCSAPNKFGLSLVTDWHLIYRTESDLIRLFSSIGKIKIEKEDLGINLFAKITK